MNSVVSAKGQITIPKALRDRLGIRPGEILDFRAERGRLIATKVAAREPVDSVYGILHLDRPTDDLINESRGRADAV